MKILSSASPQASCRLVPSSVWMMASSMWSFCWQIGHSVFMLCFPPRKEPTVLATVRPLHRKLEGGGSALQQLLLGGLGDSNPSGKRLPQSGSPHFANAVMTPLLRGFRSPHCLNRRVLPILAKLNQPALGC